ncbi:hypothetical protein QCD60_29515 [Pokkaliibacter sp. MBI-7]|uniref:hypothetical protein n=1 Tax=Pokkaliibacter sp. MBI-7 TaxID=3040600 RepID=UPI00244D63FA|nr:hypothetical protein [Pokkaliibacter sp. MBI-7]MDH2436656.1 hypothetical protein [Pokkaliibacter sp. MBI-7]
MLTTRVGKSRLVELALRQALDEDRPPRPTSLHADPAGMAEEGLAFSQAWARLSMHPDLSRCASGVAAQVVEDASRALIPLVRRARGVLGESMSNTDLQAVMCDRSGLFALCERYTAHYLDVMQPLTWMLVSDRQAQLHRSAIPRECAGRDARMIAIVQLVRERQLRIDDGLCAALIRLLGFSAERVCLLLTAAQALLADEGAEA